MESWGKRRRRSIANATEEKAEDMTLSQEILVLDFGDEKQSDFLKSDASIDFNEAGNRTTDDFSCLEVFVFLCNYSDILERIFSKKYLFSSSR